LKLSKSFFARLFWFVVGGVLSIAVNAGLFRLFFFHFGWNRYVAYGLSLAIINVLLFLWNYFVGFETKAHWSVSAWRQAVCLAVANSLNYGLVMLLQGLFPRWPEAVIAVVQVFIAFFKFGLYHYWVYPQHGPELAAEETSPPRLEGDAPSSPALPRR
jgi:putative flippase GtrA